MRCKVWKNSLCLILVFALCAGLSGCGAQRTRLQFFSMDTIMEMTAYGDRGNALSLARERIESLDALLDATDPDSAVSRLQNGQTLPADLLNLLQTVQQIADWTDHALDVTLYPISDAWGFYSGQYSVPSDAQLRTLLQNRGTWSVRDGCYYCTGDVKLDLGCAAKGYAAQCAVDMLRENGIRSAILSLGGNVQTLGQKPDGSDWVVSVADPDNSQGSVGDLHIGECAVVTSGSYQRFFEQDGKTYHHILHPQTGKPAQSGLLSATVLCTDGAAADALSTALFVMGMDAAVELYRYAASYFSYEALFITEDHSVYITRGLADRFTQTNDAYAPYQILQ